MTLRRILTMVLLPMAVAPVFAMSGVAVAATAAARPASSISWFRCRAGATGSLGEPAHTNDASRPGVSPAG
jgi:hypothetical protein